VGATWCRSSPALTQLVDAREGVGTAGYRAHILAFLCTKVPLGRLPQSASSVHGHTTCLPTMQCGNCVRQQGLNALSNCFSGSVPCVITPLYRLPVLCEIPVLVEVMDSDDLSEGKIGGSAGGAGGSKSDTGLLYVINPFVRSRDCFVTHLIPSSSVACGSTGTPDLYVTQQHMLQRDARH
jgi:hypothetical protein